MGSGRIWNDLGATPDRSPTPGSHVLQLIAVEEHVSLTETQHAHIFEHKKELFEKGFDLGQPAGEPAEKE